MKKLLVALGFLALPLVFVHPVDATTAIFAQKQISLNFTVTLSPTPVVYIRSPQAPTAIASTVVAFLTPSDPLDRLLAYEPIRLTDFSNVVAATQGGLKVDFKVKPDPKFANFHIIPHTTSFNVGYGATPPILCAYEVFAYYTTAWSVSDWVYGSNTSGGTAGLSGFPTYNYPSASQLAWKAEGITTSFKLSRTAARPARRPLPGSPEAPSRSVSI